MTTPRVDAKQLIAFREIASLGTDFKAHLLVQVLDDLQDARQRITELEIESEEYYQQMREATDPSYVRPIS